MCGYSWLSVAQIARLRPYSPESSGRPRVDDRWRPSGIIYLRKNGLQCRDAPSAHGPPKTLYDRFDRWSRIGAVARIGVERAQPGPDRETITIDSTHPKAHHMAAGLSKAAGGRAPSGEPQAD